MTRWSPDTCGCVLEVTDQYWENPNPANCKVIKSCPIHTRIPNPPAEVRRENKSKNQAYMAAIEAVKPATLVNFRWRFSADRKLVLSFKTLALTDQQKAEAELILGKKLDGAEITEFQETRLARKFGVEPALPTTALKARVLVEIDKSIGVEKVVVE